MAGVAIECFLVSRQCLGLDGSSGCSVAVVLAGNSPVRDHCRRCFQGGSLRQVNGKRLGGKPELIQQIAHDFHHAVLVHADPGNRVRLRDRRNCRHP